MDLSTKYQMQQEALHSERLVVLATNTNAAFY
jgi:hypothetical protein